MLYHETIDRVTLRGADSYRVAEGLIKLAGWPNNSLIRDFSSDSRNVPFTFFAANPVTTAVFLQETLEEIGGEEQLYEGWSQLQHPPDLALVQRFTQYRQSKTDDYLIAFIRQVDPNIRVNLNDKLRELVPDWSWAARWNSVVDSLASRFKIAHAV